MVRKPQLSKEAINALSSEERANLLKLLMGDGNAAPANLESDMKELVGIVKGVKAQLDDVDSQIANDREVNEEWREGVKLEMAKMRDEQKNLLSDINGVHGAVSDLTTEQNELRAAMRGMQEEETERRDMDERRKKPGKKPADLNLMREKPPLTKEEEGLKVILQERTKFFFEDVTGLTAKDDTYPSQSGTIKKDGREFFVPDLEKGVNAGPNDVILKKISNTVKEEAKTSHIEQLKEISLTATDADFRWAVNNCFRGVKRGVVARRDSRKEETEQRASDSRKRMRKTEAFFALCTAAELYEKESGKDPRPLIEEDLLSDTETEFEVIDQAGRVVPDADPGQIDPTSGHKGRKYLKVFRPEWRSDEYQKLLNELRAKLPTGTIERRVQDEKRQGLPNKTKLRPFQVSKDFKKKMRDEGKTEELTRAMLTSDVDGFVAEGNGDDGSD